MVVRTNTMSTNAYRQLSTNNTQLAKSLEKLSSGYRINRAGDDASGLAISEKMKAQIQGLTQASANSQDGISLVQTAEGALTEVHSMLNRMVSLATKSANGTIQDNVDRDAIQTEVDSLNTEITRIAKSTNFNGINLLDGSLGTVTTTVPLSIGSSGATGVSGAANNGLAAHTIDFKASAPAGLQITIASGASAAKNMSAAWSGTSLTVTLQANAATTFNQTDLDTAIASASGAPAAAQTMKITLNNDITITGPTSVGSSVTVTTADPKQASSTNSTTGVTVTASKAGTEANWDMLDFGVGNAFNPAGTAEVLADGSANVYLDTAKTYSADEINSALSDAGAEMRVSFDGTRKYGVVAAPDTFFGAYTLVGGAGLPDGAGGGSSSTSGGLILQVGDSNDSFNKVTVSVGDLTAEGLGTAGLDVSTQTAAGNSIATIKSAINTVSTNRGNLGALQNRLEYAINSMDTTTENMDAANSRIRDTDMAKEMMNYTKMNILSQAAQAMLAQANQNPQSILQLLQ
ncbi:MAG: flagellin [Firmicutes bacterium HGW-Firmicutes-16]|nr:MAG: flagellin [Firmicutes bacterium HGW-Firmicutes-16]